MEGRRSRWKGAGGREGAKGVKGLSWRDGRPKEGAVGREEGSWRNTRGL